jgi:signal transduction histidine kinase
MSTFDRIIVLLALAAVVAQVVVSARAVRRLRTAEAEARAKADALDEFRKEIVTTVSHELRTPLTVIQGLVNMLARRWDKLDEATKLDIVDNLSMNVSSLDASILHFIDAARIERGEPVRAEDVTLAKVVDEVQAKLATVLAGYTVAVHLEVDKAWADKEGLTRVLELLMENAARFSPLGSTITVRARRDADGVVVSVADQGDGIPPSQLDRVWEPFWRADVSDSGISRGAGLGLAIVKELAERHGGAASVTSVRGRGSTFRVTFPDPGEAIVAHLRPIQTA